jgi:hypothetical protein
LIGLLPTIRTAPGSTILTGISFFSNTAGKTWLPVEKPDLAEFRALRIMIDLGMIESEPGEEDAVGSGG